MKPVTPTSRSGCQPLLGVVTVTYNAASFLEPFLACCKAQEGVRFELLVIDNQSSDDTVNVLSQHMGKRVTVLINPTNVGYAAACNQALAYFRERGVRLVLFINNDTEFGSDLFAGLLKAQRQTGASAVTPRITYYANPALNWYAGGSFIFWKGFQGQHDGKGKPQSDADSESRWVDCASGCCVLFEMAVFDEVGEFDETYFVYFEDTDLFLRMRRAGIKLLYVPYIAIAHKISQSTGGTQSDFSIRYSQRNQIYGLRKNFGPLVLVSQLLIIVPKIILRRILGRDTTKQLLLRFESIIEGMRLKVEG